MQMRIVVFVLLLPFLMPSPAFAYLDPGTGSMLVSALVGILATLIFFIKGLWYKGSGFFYALAGKTHHREHNSLVFYSEGRQYWNTFRPVLEALAKKGEACAYLTSDEGDPGLSCGLQGVTARFIGKGNKAFATLNMLEADVCAMTTPGLDVLQIKRSRGVKHYAHIVHGAGSGVFYRLFGLDHYDSFFAPGPHQELSVRKIEALRGIKPKQIFPSGCPYFDVFMEQKLKLGELQPSEGGIRILVAPTWGINGLLAKYGQSLLKPLAEAGFQVTVRPHPQSKIVEVSLIETLQHELAAWPNLVWDMSTDGFEAMTKADLLISDYSSIIFDFAYVMERPVLTMDFTLDLSLYDAYDLGEEPWELQAHKLLGRTLSLEDIPNLVQIVEDLHGNEELKKQIIHMRETCVYNFGKAGPVIADQLIAIRGSLKGKEGGHA